MESVQFNEPASLRRLIRDLDLTFCRKDSVTKKLKCLNVTACLIQRYVICTRGCCLGSNMLSKDWHFNHSAILLTKSLSRISLSLTLPFCPQSHPPSLSLTLFSHYVSLWPSLSVLLSLCVCVGKKMMDTDLFVLRRTKKSCLYCSYLKSDLH